MIASVAASLSMRGVVKRFGRTVALDGASIQVAPGTLHALLGENGAGKTTLMRIAFGMLGADAGSLVLDGTKRAWRSTRDAIAAGIGMVHQHFLLVPAMTVAENVALGTGGPLGRFDPGRAAERVHALGAATGLLLDPHARAGDLGVGAQQRLEIARALARDARLLILDEPTAVLSPGEARELYAWLRGFVSGGRTVVLITHKVREAIALADDVTVLRRGTTVLAGAAATLAEADVVRALLGDRAPPVPAPAARAGAVVHDAGAREPVLSLRDVSVVDSRGVVRLRNATLDVRAGEVVGVAGVEGSGQRDLLRILAGRVRPSSGAVRCAPRTGFVPEDRLRDALVPMMSLTENLALKEASVARTLVPWPAYAERAAVVVREHEVRADAGVNAAVGVLSGGNQQKFVLGRELEGAPDALVVENPTRGLDVRATAHVLARLRAARDSGVAVVVYDSDLDELVALADRLVVCFAGRVIPVASDAEAAARAMVGLS